jgi:hypothetical protein
MSDPAGLALAAISVAAGTQTGSEEQVQSTSSIVNYPRNAEDFVGGLRHMESAVVQLQCEWDIDDAAPDWVLALAGQGHLIGTSASATFAYRGMFGMSGNHPVIANCSIATAQQTGWGDGFSCTLTCEGLPNADGTGDAPWIGWRCSLALRVRGKFPDVAGQFDVWVGHEGATFLHDYGLSTGRADVTNDGGVYSLRYTVLSHGFA